MEESHVPSYDPRNAQDQYSSPNENLKIVEITSPHFNNYMDNKNIL